MRVGTTVDEAERLLIMRTLEATGQNKTRAAEILGVSLKTLHNKLKEYGRTRHDSPTRAVTSSTPAQSNDLQHCCSLNPGCCCIRSGSVSARKSRRAPLCMTESLIYACGGAARHRWGNRSSDAPEDQTRAGHYGPGVSDRRGVSLVYVHQLVKAAVQQTYDTNRMVAQQVWLRCSMRWKPDFEDRTVDPNDPAELRGAGGGDGAERYDTRSRCWTR